MKTGIELIAKERRRQIEVEGWTPEHDAEHCNQELALAAVCYATPPSSRETLASSVGMYDEQTLNYPLDWPWKSKWWKPTPDDRIRELTKAGALIVAEIDRLLALKQH